MTQISIQPEVNLVIPSGQAKCSCYDMVIPEEDQCNGLCDCPSCEDESFQKCIQVGKLFWNHFKLILYMNILIDWRTDYFGFVRSLSSLKTDAR